MSSQPAGDPGFQIGWPRLPIAPTARAPLWSSTPRPRSAETDQSQGVLNLASGVAQTSGASISTAYSAFRSPPLLRCVAVSLSTSAGGGTSPAK